MLDLVDQLIFLQSIPIFKDLSIEELGQIASITKTDSFDEGEILFKEGEPGNQAYIIISGKVEIFVEHARVDKLTIATLATGEYFGEMALFDGEPRSATARTLEPSVISIYSRDDLIEVFRRSPSISIGMIQMLSKRLREVRNRYSDFEQTLVSIKKLLQHVNL